MNVRTWIHGRMEAGSASGLGRERAIERVAARQLRLLTGAQMLAAGLSRSAIDKRLQRGRLHRMHFGVYATHPPPFSREQLWLAAVLACGPGSLLSDWPAALHWRIVPSSLQPSAAPHVTAPSGRGRGRPGIVVHDRGPVHPSDRRVRGSIPLVSADLVIVQLSPGLDAVVLEQMLVAAESLGLLNRRRLGELVAARHGSPGIHKLVPLLALEPALTRSDLELLMVPIIVAAGVSRPRFNHPIPIDGRRRPFTVDLAWPELRLVVELDSQRFHGDWERAEIDRERDQLLALEGWLTHRFVRRWVSEDPRGCAERLRRLVDTRTTELRAGLVRGSTDA